MSSAETRNVAIAAATVMRDGLAPPVRSVAVALRDDAAERLQLTDCGASEVYLPMGSIEIELSAERLGRLSETTLRGRDFTNEAMPVGEYGVEFADFLLNAATVVPDFWIDDVAAQLSGSDNLGTAFGRMPSLRVGLLSTVQALAQLTAYRVRGFDDPINLIAATAESGSVITVAGLLPLAVLAPMTRSGKLFPAPLLLSDGHGGVAIAPQFIELLEREHEIYVQDVAAIRAGKKPQVRRKFLERKPFQAAGAGCPLAWGDDAALKELVPAVAAWMVRRGHLLQRPQRGVQAQPVLS